MRRLWRYRDSVEAAASEAQQRVKDAGFTFRVVGRLPFVGRRFGRLGRLGLGRLGLGLGRGRLDYFAGVGVYVFTRPSRNSQ